ncbi:MAG: DNA translocase FtsK [Candidatus Limnocylindrales bacterium]
MASFRSRLRAVPEERSAPGAELASILDESPPPGGSGPISRTVWSGETRSPQGGVGSGVGVSGAGRRAGSSAAIGASAATLAGVPAWRSWKSTMTTSTASDRSTGRCPRWSCSRSDRFGRPARRSIIRPNIRRIEEKLQHFSIPARVVATNMGPVVTQYEVRPDAARQAVAHRGAWLTTSAMALAARSIRIEAPIPGKDVVGIEIPNSVSEVVGFRRLLEEMRMHATPRVR